MGKNHRHKKQLKSEKAKVKLRLKSEKTKFLPKGANVTDTSFKIKPIVLPQQLKAKSETEPLSNRKLNVQDLLSRLKHHNVNMRKTCCIELRQIIAAYPEELIQKYLSQLLRTVCPLVLDKESIVRKEAIKLLSTMLGNTSLEKLSPFFNILSSYVRCAMTDINSSVQEDSLAFVDILLKYTPSLVSRDSDKLLPNFFNLLSKFKTHAKADKVVAGGSTQRLTNIRWRIGILTRINNIFDAIVKEDRTEDQHVGNMDVDVLLNAEEINCCPIYSPSILSHIDAFNVFGHSSITADESEVSNIEKYMDVLIPLLYDTWLEVVPEDRQIKTNRGSTILSQETVIIMDCILKILHSLLKYIKQNENSDNQTNTLFGSKDVQKFVSRFLNQFPYSSSEFAEDELKKTDKAWKSLLKLHDDAKCTRQNLLICYIFCVLNNNLTNNYYVECAKKVLKYLQQFLVNRNYVPQENWQFLIVVLKIILIDNCENWKKRNVSVSPLLEDVIHFYDNTPLRHQHQDSIFDLLCDINNEPLLNSSLRYQIWLSMLPTLLCREQISEKVIDTISLLAIQGNELFHKSLLRRLPSVLDNLPKIKISKARNQTVAYLKIARLFYYIPVLYKENIEEISKFLEQNNDSEVYKSLKEVLKLRCEVKESEHAVFQKCSWWN